MPARRYGGWPGPGTGFGNGNRRWKCWFCLHRRRKGRAQQAYGRIIEGDFRGGVSQPKQIYQASPVEGAPDLRTDYGWARARRRISRPWWIPRFKARNGSRGIAHAGEAASTPGSALRRPAAGSRPNAGSRPRPARRSGRCAAARMTCVGCLRPIAGRPDNRIC